MLAYRHGFHAGNHADVLKHLVLIALLDALKRKPKPFFVMDTHAGDGCYALNSSMAGKLHEYAEGIGRLWGHHGLHPMIDAYLTAIEAHNPKGILEKYPGSPLLIASGLRPGDRLYAAEAHGTAASALEKLLAKSAGVQTQKGDGFALLKAVLPPPEHRGLILIDPSFEVSGEYERLNEALRLIHRRFRQGMVAVWYPLLSHKPADRWLETVRQLGIPDLLVAELRIMSPPQGIGLYGSGMLLVNPPWGLETGLREALPLISEQFIGKRDGSRVAVLVDERGKVPPRA